jgi:predicted small metal-binding protein
MRVFECPCGLELTADTDDELFRSARAHIERFHPGRSRSDEQLRLQIFTVRT